MAMHKLLQPMLFVSLLCVIAGPAHSAEPGSDAAEALRARYAALVPQLSHNQFEQPLYLESAASSGHLKGEIYARVDYPFADVGAALNGPSHWCDVLILHVNTKYCHAAMTSGGTTLAVNLGSKKTRRLEDTYRVEFSYRVVESAPDYFQVQLAADKGPLATSDYLIVLEAVAIDGAQTFLHFTYSYAYGVAARLAMKTYLGTSGRAKVGFTIVGQRADGDPEYVRGVRGLIERNTMRYYLAIDAYLDAEPAGELEQRLQNWFASTELYPQQLRELDQTDYLAMKRSEYARQQASLVGTY